MASCTWSSSLSGSPSVTLTVTQSSQSAADNTSTVSYSLVISRPYNISSSASKSYSITINGSTVKSGTTTIGGSGSKTIASGTTTISHNADGTKSISFSFNLALAITWGGTYISTASSSGSMTLSTIARATQPSLSSSTTAMGSSVTISMPRASSNFKHILYYDWYGSGWQVIKSELDTSYTWTIPLSFANSIPSATSGWGTIYCETYNNEALIGTKSVTFTATVPSSVVPTISKVSITEATEGLAAKFGAFVQNKSTLAVEITAAGAYGSTIKSYETYIQAAPYRAASFTSALITTSGTIGVVTTVTDSRGRTAKVTNSVTVIAYSPPVINSLSVERIDTSGNYSDDGERIAVSMSFAISPVNNLNDHTFALKYKATSDTEFATFSSGSADWTYDGTQSFTDSPVISQDSSYTIRFEVSDYFQTVAYEFSLPSAFTLMDFHSTGKGMSIGKVSEKDALEIAMDMEVTGKAKIFAPASNVADSGYLRLYRADGTLAAFLATSDEGNGLNLHLYSGGAWSGVVKVTKDGALTVNNAITASTYKGGQSGTWTPKSTESTMPFSASDGVYYKIGRLVFIKGYIQITASSSSTGAVAMTNLPFTAAQEAVIPIGYGNLQVYTSSSKSEYMDSYSGWFISSGSKGAFIKCFKYGRVWGQNWNTIGTGDLAFAGCYLTDE